MDPVFEVGSTKELPSSPDDAEIESANSGPLSQEIADLNSAKQYLGNLPLGNNEDFDSISESVTDTYVRLEGGTVSFGKVDFRPSEVARTPSLTEDRQLNGSNQREIQKNRTSSADEHLSASLTKISKDSLPTPELVTKLQSEVDMLRQTLKDLQENSRKLPPVKVTVEKMIKGEEYFLERYRSKEDKLKLLDESIAAHDGNAITAAVLFLRSSTEFAIFNRELLLRPTAVEHFICFLRQHRLYEDLIRFLVNLGRKEEAAMLSYQVAITSAKSRQEKLSKIDQCYRNFFQSDATVATEAALISEQLNLIPTQQQIEEYDKKNAARVYYLLPCKASVVGTSVITSLFYLCLYHFQSPENSVDSPLFLSKAHKLSDKQYQWTALRARSQLRNWKDVEKLFETKGFFGGMKLKAIMGFDRVVALISQMKAPREILNKYCALIDDANERLEVGTRFRCHKTVIDTYVQLKDRLQLINYMSKLQQGLQDWKYANDILNTSTLKWKN